MKKGEKKIKPPIIWENGVRAHLNEADIIVGGKKHILRFEISVNDALAVEVLRMK